MGPRKIHVHHHILPSKVVEVMEKRPPNTQGLRFPEWSQLLSEDFMDRNEISTAILSFPMPLSILSQDDIEAASLAREINEEMAKLRNEQPSKFGFFATLPSLDNTQSCRSEIRYAVEALGADGFTLFTSYSEKYLGHPDFAPIWEELSARSAIILIHPTIEGAQKAIQDPFPLPRPICDWPHETTRTAIHLILTGTLRKYAGCSIILSHGGGTLPYIAGRAADLSDQMKLLDPDKPDGGFLDDCRKFYFDMALATYQGPLQLLLDFAAAGHVLYGTDFPFARDRIVAQRSADIDAVLVERGVSAQVERGAAEVLFRRLRGHPK